MEWNLFRDYLESTILYCVPDFQLFLSFISCTFIKELFAHSTSTVRIMATPIDGTDPETYAFALNVSRRIDPFFRTPMCRNKSSAAGTNKKDMSADPLLRAS